MISVIIACKLGMSRLFMEDGRFEPVTLVEAQPCTVAQVKTEARDGYNALQLGSGAPKRRHTAPEAGEGPNLRFRVLREFRVKRDSGLKVGDTIDVTTFQAGDIVNVTGISKGRGFAGTVKRHGFAGGPKTHGQSDRHRAPGSIGATSSPGRVLKGTRMAGHMGNHRVTVRNLKVVAVEPSRNILMLKGAVPGAREGLLLIQKTVAGGRNETPGL